MSFLIMQFAICFFILGLISINLLQLYYQFILKVVRYLCLTMTWLTWEFFLRRFRLIYIILVYWYLVVVTDHHTCNCNQCCLQQKIFFSTFKFKSKTEINSYLNILSNVETRFKSYPKAPTTKCTQALKCHTSFSEKLECIYKSGFQTWLLFEVDCYQSLVILSCINLVYLP